MRVIGTLGLVVMLAGVIGTAGSASARLPEAFSNLPKEIVRKAVHTPTGCLAQITIDDRRVVHASIIDPDCLPTGVKARPVPGTKRDFTVIDGIR